MCASQMWKYSIKVRTYSTGGENFFFMMPVRMENGKKCPRGQLIDF